jgi:hypothetical protein
MKLLPFIDRHGNVRLWFDPNSGWAVNNAGQSHAVIWFDGLYDRRGKQIGWWYGDHVRDLDGRVMLFEPRTNMIGLALPVAKPLPHPPVNYARLKYPHFARKSGKPLKKPEWIDFDRPSLGRLRAWIEEIKTPLTEGV